MNDLSDVAQRRSRLSPAKRALLERRLQGKPEEQASLRTISRRADRTVAPLSFAQQRLWFLDLLEPDSSAYNMPAAYRLVGPLDVTALEQAINKVVRRHEVLRTTFAAVDGEPVQVIAPSLRVPLLVADLESLPRAEREAEALRLGVDDVHDPFDLSQGPLLRARLLRLGAEEHILVLTLHHIVTDGWSAGVFRRELAELYAASSRGRPSPLPELPVQYADFAVWQRKWLEGGAMAGQLSYWRERLEGASELQLPGDRPRPAQLSYEAAGQTQSFSPELSSALKALSRREGVTLFMTLLAAFKVLLYRYTGQEDVVVGTPIANRDRAEIEGLIGFFANTLALRTDLSGARSGALTFGELLAREREVCLTAYGHQHLPFEKLVEELQPQRDLSRNPFFQVMFSVQNAPRGAMEMAGLTVTPLALEDRRVRFDVECGLWEEGERIEGKWVYRTSLFDAATMARMAAHYETLLEGVVSDPQQRIAEIPLLPQSERQQILVEWNATQVAQPIGETVLDLFERQVLQTPEAASCVMAGQEMTYGQLNARANQVAHFLQGRGVGPEVLVGLCCERSFVGMVGLLGILKAGAAYVPLDPTYPRERLAFLLRDSGVPVLLTQRTLVNRLPQSDAQVVYLDSEWEVINRESEETPARRAGPGNVAYVPYTSGSTGQPKGVVMEHGSLHNLITWQVGSSAVSQGARTLQFSPLSFDFSFHEIFTTWCAGGTLVLISEELRRDPFALLQFLARETIARLYLPFTPLQQLVLAAEERDTMPASLREVSTGGEQLQTTPQLADFFRKLPDCRLHNLYGPTEAHVVTTFSLEGSPDGWSALPPIGRPIANTQIYLLDPHLQPVPIGIPGELYIGGRALARGYLNRPSLVAERFIPHPLNEEPGARLYRTGDVARYLPDGNIEFLGRTDHQVKIRGFRIELGEIETVLEGHPAVRQCVVLALEDTPGDTSSAPGTGKRLVAYVVPKQIPGPTVGELRYFLNEKLPQYMLPSAFVLLDNLPLTPGGKVDRAALPAPDQRRPEPEGAFTAPRTPVEVKLAEIWAKVLRLERVGVHDSFFELGGHSLLATQVVSRIRDTFHMDLPLRSIFERQTIAGLATLIEQIPSVVGKTEPPGADTADEREDLVL